MNKQDFIKAWAAKNDLTYKDAEKFFDSFVDTIEEELKGGQKIQLVGFGTFEIKQKAAKSGISALTGKPYSTPACQVPTFKVAAGFKKKF